MVILKYGLTKDEMGMEEIEKELVLIFEIKIMCPKK